MNELLVASSLNQLKISRLAGREITGSATHGTWKNKTKNN